MAAILEKTLSGGQILHDFYYVILDDQRVPKSVQKFKKEQNKTNKQKNKTKQSKKKKKKKKKKKPFVAFLGQPVLFPVYSEKRGILAAILFFNRSNIIVSVALHLFNVNDIYQHIRKTQNGRCVPFWGKSVEF